MKNTLISFFYSALHIICYLLCYVFFWGVYIPIRLYWCVIPALAFYLVNPYDTSFFFERLIILVPAFILVGIICNAKSSVKTIISAYQIIDNINYTFNRNLNKQEILKDYYCTSDNNPRFVRLIINIWSIADTRTLKAPLIRDDSKRELLLKKSQKTSGEKKYAYIYAIIEFFSTDNYDLFEYCERHLINKDNFFHKNIFESLTNIVKKNYRYRSSDPYHKILQVLCENYVTIDFDKLLHEILTHINQSRNKAKSIVSEYDKQYVDEMYDMYISEIEEKIR